MKRFKIFFTIVVLLLSGLAHSQIGIGTSEPDPSAILDLTSTSQGLLLPRMTGLQQTNLENPAIGLIVFNTTTGQIETNKGDGLGGSLWVGGPTTTGVTAPLGTNTTQLATTEFVIANTGNYIFKEGIGAEDTSSRSNVVISGMTVTPPAGTYSVSFNSQYNNALITSTNTDFMDDLLSAYDQITSIQEPAISHIATFGTESLIPGVYSIVGASTVTGILTLNAGGNPNAIFIIKATGSITVAAGSQIKLTNSANPANVFWVSEGAINVGAGCVAKGIFISNGSALSMGDGTSLDGRMFTTIGAIAFGTGTAKTPGLSTIIDLGSLSTFIFFTNNGAINNSGLSTITGDILTNLGATGSLAIATVIGTIYDPNVGILITNTVVSNGAFGIFKDGIVIPNSVRNIKSSGNTLIIALQSLVTVDGTQTIDIRWKTDLTKLSIGNRTLTLIKVH
jgi:hypothetical protein